MPATAPGTPENPLRIMATTSALPLVMEAAAAYDDPNLSLQIRSGNYRQTIEALRRGDAHFIVTTHLDSGDINTLWAAPIAQDAIALVVNPANPVMSLTLPQLRQIFQGHISSWGELGWPDEPMLVVSREAGAGIRAEFNQQVMGTRQTTGAAMIASSSEGVLHAVVGHTGALGYISLAALTPSVRPLAIAGVLPTLATLSDNTYPLRSTVFIVGRDEPTGSALSFIGWMQSAEGQNAFGRMYRSILATPSAD